MIIKELINEMEYEILAGSEEILRLWYMIPARLKKVLCLCASAEVCVMHMSLFRMWQQREQRPLS